MMRRQKRWGRGIQLMVFVMVACLALLMSTSCAKKKISVNQDAGQAAGSDAATQDAQAAAEEEEAARRRLEEERILEEERLKQEQAQQAALEASRKALGEQDIFFDFDSAALTMEAQEILTLKAQWLRENPGVQVTIEGHTDSRGTVEYNLALGERRAESAKNFLEDLGIDPARMISLSYGEEAPMDMGENESSWAKNRRAHFVIQ